MLHNARVFHLSVAACIACAPRALLSLITYFRGHPRRRRACLPPDQDQRPEPSRALVPSVPQRLRILPLRTRTAVHPHRCTSAARESTLPAGPRRSAIGERGVAYRGGSMTECQANHAIGGRQEGVCRGQCGRKQRQESSHCFPRPSQKLKGTGGAF